MMRQRKKKWRLLAVLLCAGIWLQACTPENSVSQIFRERIISGSVDEEQKKQQAQEPVADSRQLEQEAEEAHICLPGSKQEVKYRLTNSQ